MKENGGLNLRNGEWEVKCRGKKHNYWDIACGDVVSVLKMTKSGSVVHFTLFKHHSCLYQGVKLILPQKHNCLQRSANQYISMFIAQQFTVEYSELEPNLYTAPFYSRTICLRERKIQIIDARASACAKN